MSLEGIRIISVVCLLPMVGMVSDTAVAADASYLGPVDVVGTQDGKRLFFEQADCAKCHDGPRYTDGKLHDVGSRARYDQRADFDTPTLVEVWRTAPYRHDGKYVTVKEHLVEGKHSKHVKNLSEQLQANWDSLAALRQQAMLGHPALDFNALLFVKSTYQPSSTYRKHNANTTAKYVGGNLCVLSPVSPEGKVTELVPELSGGVFQRTPFVLEVAFRRK